MLPDNRIILPGPKIDFSTQVGLTGQDHDNYPPSGQQARFDHLRSFLIGLLANQSGYSPPGQFREGSCWYDLNSGEMKVRQGTDWVPMSEAIVLDPVSGLTLAGWYSTITDPNTAIRKAIGNTSLGASDRTLLADATGGSFSVTLPSAGISNGKEYFVKKISTNSNTVTLVTSGGQLIDSSGSKPVNPALHVQFLDGTWYTLN